MEGILQKLKKFGLNIFRTDFTEDGYEMWITPLSLDEPEMFATAVIRKKLDEIENMDYSGYVPVEYILDKGVCKVLLVPKNEEQFTEFVWTYIENWGDTNRSIEDMLMEACCALEKAIERIPKEYSKVKKEAEVNYVKFTKMIF